MLIGVPKEIKNHEYRVGLTPQGVAELVKHGHQVSVEQSAGVGIGFSDADYQQAGATIVAEAALLFQQSEMIIKVKEPQPHESAWLKAGQVLFTYLHLAADKNLTEALLASGVTAIAYETVTDPQGRLPLLAPMSQVAGRMSIQAGAHCLEKAQGGSGVLLGGVPGVKPANVLILGGGVVGEQAARMALGMGASVTVADLSLSRLAELDQQYGPNLHTQYATSSAIAEQLRNADLVIGAVLIPGASAPKLVSRGMLATMKQGSVLVDVAIDQGGCFESSHPTTHAAPTFIEEGIVHYCVANMPGAVANTSTQALTHATLPYILRLADQGWHSAMRKDRGLLKGLNTNAGQLHHPAVAAAFDFPYVDVQLD